MTTNTNYKFPFEKSFIKTTLIIMNQTILELFSIHSTPEPSLKAIKSKVNE